MKIHLTRKSGLIILAIVLLSMLLCFAEIGLSTIRSIGRDSFYNDSGGWYYPRFPLIKPYYVDYLNDEYGWTMPLLADPPSKSTYDYLNIHKIQKIAVESGVIMVYAPYIENVDQSQGQKILHWFVIIPSQNIEEGFENETSFLNYISSFGIQQPQWHTPDEIVQQYSTGCLDWIPNCK